MPLPTVVLDNCFSIWRSYAFLFFACAGLVACQSVEDGNGENKQQQQPASGQELDVPDQQVSGEDLARIHCQRCHAFTEPKTLDKQTWKEVILPRMGHRMGIYKGGKRPDSLFEEGAGGKFVREAGIFPKEPVLSKEHWEKIVAYYMEEAPSELPSASPHSDVTMNLPGFEVHRPAFRFEPPRTTMVKVEDGRHVLVGQLGKKQTLALLDPHNTLFDTDRTRLSKMALPGIPSSLQRVGTTRYMTLMGHVAPSDQPTGKLVRLDLKPQTNQYRYVTLVDSLRRPVYSSHADLTGNERRDIVVCEFGHRTGSLSWFERLGNGQFEKHVLRDAPGALRSVVRDFNGNGRPDVMALMGQGDEGIYLFHNQGNGEFRDERLLRFPPTYGSTHFELVDFNDDGHLDILHTAGDNADYEPVMKPYHGIRIFLNDGENNFDELYFYPLNGAYNATAQDFDGDGDLDIAAISFFPDYDNARAESFIFLENQGSLEFEPYTFRERNQGRWLRLDHGDIDRDGDKDLVLGSFSAIQFNMAYVPESLASRWRQQGPSVIALENLHQTD